MKTTGKPLKLRPGRLNLITDIAGLEVGNIEDNTLKSGVTALISNEPFVSSVHVMGGAPGTRDSELLSPENLVESVDALCLSGGSAFGLDAMTGVQSALREQGRGFVNANQRIPIVPGAILFDLANGGDKNWGLHPPYRELGYQAASNARDNFELGSVGAGTGALIAGLKGGMGSASTIMENGITIGALVAVNALGAATIGDTKHFWAAPFELDDEFGGFGPPYPFPANAKELRIKFRDQMAENSNTTIGIIATDAKLTKAQAKRLAIAAHDGFARALWPTHTPLDGDLVFAVATGKNDVDIDLTTQIDLSAFAASTMARAIARGVFEASSAENDIMPTWQEKFG